MTRRSLWQATQYRSRRLRTDCGEAPVGWAAEAATSSPEERPEPQFPAPAAANATAAIMVGPDPARDIFIVAPRSPRILPARNPQ